MRCKNASRHKQTCEQRQMYNKCWVQMKKTKNCFFVLESICVLQFQTVKTSQSVRTSQSVKTFQSVKTSQSVKTFQSPNTKKTCVANAKC